MKKVNECALGEYLKATVRDFAISTWTNIAGHLSLTERKAAQRMKQTNYWLENPGG